MSNVHEDANFPATTGLVALELVIRRGLHCSPKLVSLDIEALALAWPMISGSPGIDDELHEHHTFRVEEKENFVQPIDDLRRFIVPVL